MITNLLSSKFMSGESDIYFFLLAKTKKPQTTAVTGRFSSAGANLIISKDALQRRRSSESLKCSF